MRQEIGFRLATSKDVGNLLDMQRRAMRALASSAYTATQIEAFNFHLAASTNALVAAGRLCLAERGSDIIACGGWTTDHGEVGLCTAARPDDAQLAVIRSLYTAPQYARQGIGRAMLHHLERQAMFAGKSRFELAATLNAVPMYQACGYAAVRPFLLPLPDATTLSGLLMVKSITASAAAAA
jgi:GNAT superfamily N-acetyltransferase